MSQTVNAGIETRIEAMITEADRLSAAYFARMHFTHRPPDRHAAENISDKWCRIVTCDIVDGMLVNRSVYGFVALCDFSNKTLGQVCRGDIHKAASWKAPARTARGNVFMEDFGGCLTEFGIVYLRS